MEIEVVLGEIREPGHRERHRVAAALDEGVAGSLHDDVGPSPAAVEG